MKYEMKYRKYIMMISNTVNPKGMSPSRMRHVTVLLVFSLKFTHVKMKGPNKSIQPQILGNLQSDWILLGGLILAWFEVVYSGINIVF